MPIINGQKMACEPCIRGHRSTKCTHAKERLMVPVRKPGRPLSICPHPPGKPCSCGGITAAIPRAQKCGCGTNNSASSGTATITPASSVTDSPTLKGSTSPTRRSFQIQKPSSKTNGRKQSFDPSTLARMDPNNYNLHAAPPFGAPLNARSMSLSLGHGNAMSAAHTNSHLDHLDYIPSIPTSFDHSPTMLSPTVGFEGRLEYPLGVQLDGHPDFAPESEEKPETARGLTGSSLENGSSYFSNMSDLSAKPSGTTRTRTLSGGGPVKGNIASAAPATTAPGSCCGGKSSETVTNGNVNGSGNGSCDVNDVRNGDRNGHSAVSNGNGDVTQQPLSHYQQIPPDAAGNGLAITTMSPAATPIMGAFNHQPLMHTVYFSQSADPTIYTYPPFYGTFQYPIQPPQWRQAAMSVGGPMASGPTPGHLDASVHGVNFGVGGDAAAAVGTSHQCTCGDSCNCLGCPAHPYNERTKDYVRSAMDSMAEGDHHHHHHHQNHGGSEQVPVTKTTTTTTTIATAAAEAEGVSPTTAGPVASCCGGAGEPSSPDQPQTPSEASGISEDQTQLSASDYLFVTYPYGPCEGETASCPCGDDCQCVGCMIHSHNQQNSI